MIFFSEYKLENIKLFIYLYLYYLNFSIILFLDDWFLKDVYLLFLYPPAITYNRGN